ncbi:hypothetical protein ACOMHN_024269 [Nucella lapillus]
MSGFLQNNGHDITFYAEHSGMSRWDGVNITGGPLSYRYRVDQIKLHFGLADSEGSEHTVAGKSFPVELSDKIHREFTVYQRVINSTLYKGDKSPIERLRLRRLLPPTDQYVTYEGSTTFPGCHETVTWIVYNRPVYIGKQQLSSLRNVRQDTRFNPVMLMGGNIRPVQPLHQRAVRTNINFVSI